MEKNKSTLISVRLTEFSGMKAVDIREYFQTAKDGKLCPTKKGVFVPVEHLSALVNLLEQAEARYNDITTQGTQGK